MITFAGDVKSSYEEQVLKLKSLKETVSQLKTQVKSTVDQAKSTYNKAKDTYEKGKTAVMDAKQKAEAIKSKVEGTVNNVKNIDVKGATSKVEFAGLNNAFDGTKNDEEMAKAVADTFTITNPDQIILQNLQMKAIVGARNGHNIGNMFGEATVLRQDLRAETDDVENPTNVGDAISLSQEATIRSMDRRRRIRGFEASINEFEESNRMTRYRDNFGGGSDE